ncbi:porphobilinogen deaminase [Peniophora sp. CONT]|nr:porphobilinogen deaminase [Peniophora sp. CONT]
MSSSEAPKRSYVLASRASVLAKIQTEATVELLQRSHPQLSFSTSYMTTEGDRNQSQALYVLGGKSLWTKDLEVSLLEGAVDMLVHCVKDMPTTLPPGCIITAITERENPVDSLVVKKDLRIDGKEVKTLSDLPEGAVVGTSSVRRVAQLRRHFPRLQFQDIRGNLTTRMRKLDDPEGPYAAIILAKAGMVRQGLGDRLTADLPAPTLYYAVGQGALCIEIREGDKEVAALCEAITHWPTQWECLAERACLHELEGGCSVPVGVNTKLTVENDTAEGRRAKIEITGTITSLDGQRHVQQHLVETLESIEQAQSVGVRLARALTESGGAAILDDIKEDRAKRQGENKTAEEVAKIEAAQNPTA